MNIWGLVFLFQVSFLSSALLCTNASATSDPASKVAALESLFVPAITQATEWSTKVALGLVSGTAFYALVVRFIKL
jgi:hypothetical protein